MGLSIHVLPLGDTTEREIAELTGEIVAILEKTRGVEGVTAVSHPSRGGTKGMTAIIGAFLLTATPLALKQVLPVLKAFLSRPGQPMTEVVVQDGTKKTTLRFNPKEIPIQDLVEGVLRLRDRPKGGRG
jgi:hypothetical protein